MRARRSRLTLGRIMAVIGVVALILAMRRVDSAPAVSLCVFAACAWYLAARRFAETMALRTAEGLTTSRARRVRILLGAANLAVVAIGLPDGTFLAGYYAYMEAIRATIVVKNWRPDYDPWHMLIGSVIGIVSALSVASIVRRWTGPILGARASVSAKAPRARIRSISRHERISTRG